MQPPIIREHVAAIPASSPKIKLVVHHSSVQAPKLEILNDGTKIVQRKCFKYLGYDLDTKLSFQALVTAQTNRMQKTYQILKRIHRQFPASVRLKKQGLQYIRMVAHEYSDARVLLPGEIYAEPSGSIILSKMPSSDLQLAPLAYSGFTPTLPTPFRAKEVSEEPNQTDE